MVVRYARAAFAAGLVLALLLPALVLANSAPPTFPGDAIGEPAGELADIHIESEDLQFDLRPLETADDVKVSATYRIQNDAEARTVDLVFVATALSEAGGGVWLDGQPVPFVANTGGSTSQPPADVPWTPTQTTPGFDGRPLGYSVRFNGTLRFTLDIPPGAHEIRVQYSAEPAFINDSQVIIWQVGYVLAPARRWASFGTLNVLVQLPPDWLFASDPPLQRTGDEARGTFTGVPADSVALTAQYPFRSIGALDKPLFWAAIAAISGVGLLISFVGGTLAGRRGSTGSGLFPLSLVYGVLGGLLVVYIGALAPGGGSALPGFQAGSSYASVGTGLVNIAISFAAGFLFAIVLTIGMQVVARLAARRSRRTPQPI